MKNENEMPSDAPEQTPSKPVPPSYKTIEFWVAVAVAIAAFGEHIAGVLPGEWAVAVAAISATLYKLARALRESKAKEGGE